MAISPMERIEQLRGLEELKALARRLWQVAENKRALPMTRVQLPNYLFIEAPGCGVTTHIRMITDLLQELLRVGAALGVDGIIFPRPDGALPDDAGGAENFHVVGKRGLRNAELFKQRAGALFPLCEHFQHAQTPLVRRMDSGVFIGSSTSPRSAWRRGS